MIMSACRMARIASGFAWTSSGSRKISFTWPCSVIADSPRMTLAVVGPRAQRE